MSCCQYVSLHQLVILIDRLRNAPLSADERAGHERFFLKCVPSAEALAFVMDPAHHPANPTPGSVPDNETLARVAVAMRG